LTVALPARAKLNLDLQVLKRRDDGFHEIRTRMQAVALHDVLEAAPAKRTTFQADGLPVPGGGDNIVLKAHAALEQATGRALPTEFHLHKRIPPGAGLGGASSDAATALRALKIIHAVDASQVEIAKLARAIGADVPFFLTGGSALAERTGEHLTPMPTQPAWYAIAGPVSNSRQLAFTLRGTRRKASRPTSCAARPSMRTAVFGISPSGLVLTGR